MPSKEDIEDFISGNLVKGGTEEIEAVQVFSKKLVNDYGYKKSQIQTHPQFRVKTAPSGEEKYPVDITVFKTDKKTYDNVYMVVECKQPNRTDGLTQLNIYLNLVPSVELGVWFNGKEHVYLRKISDVKKGVRWEHIPDIPRFNQRIEDVGLYKRKDLIKPSNLTGVFDDIRNHLAGNTTGITRDEAFAQEIINILFCKLFDEFNREPDEQVQFRAGVSESKEDVKKRIDDLFESVKQQYDDLFESQDQIKLDADSVLYIVGELQKFVISEADRDSIGEAFEVFIGPALRGGEGQFFTPRNVVRMAVEMLDPRPDEYVIDPACGSGGFLIVVLEHMWKKIEAEGKKKKWNRDYITAKRSAVATKFIHGLDKDSFLSKVTKAYMAIIGDGRGGIFSENSVHEPKSWKEVTRSKIQLNKYHIVVTNPPFGVKIPIKGDSILSQYDLAKKWKYDKDSDVWNVTNQMVNKRPPQVLFIERCLQFLRPGGKMAIVLPDSIVGNQTDGYIREFILSKARLLAVVDCPIETFANHTKTSVVLLQKKQEHEIEKNYEIFMVHASTCGHDKRGAPTYKTDSSGMTVIDDDIQLVSTEYEKFLK